MLTYGLIALVIFVVVLLILFKIAKKVFKIVLIVSIILSVVGAVFGYLVYQDGMELKEKFATEEKIILLKHQGQVVAGLQGVFAGGEEINPLEDIQTIQDHYQDNQFDKILGDNYKLIIVNSSAFKDVETVYFADQDRPLEEIFSYLSSDSALDDFAEKLLQEKNLPTDPETKSQITEDLKSKFEINDDDGFKGILFGLLLQGKQPDRFFLLRNEIYPETIIFKIIKAFPLDIIENLV